MTYEVFETCVFVRGLNTTQCASWVQAIGSLAAIAVAWFLASQQARRLALEKVADDAQRTIEKVAPAIAIIEAAIDELKSIHAEALNSIEGGRFQPPHNALERARIYEDVFKTIQIANMPSVDCAKVALRVRHLLSQSDGVLNVALNRLDPQQEIPGSVRDELQAFLTDLGNQAQLLKAELVRITAPPSSRRI